MMDETADLTVVQTIIDTLHLQGKPSKVISGRVGCLQLEEEWRGTESKLCEVSTVVEDLGCRLLVLVYCVLVQGQCNHLPEDFIALKAAIKASWSLFQPLQCHRPIDSMSPHWFNKLYYYYWVHQWKRSIMYLSIWHFSKKLSNEKMAELKQLTLLIYCIFFCCQVILKPSFGQIGHKVMSSKPLKQLKYFNYVT